MTTGQPQYLIQANRNCKTHSQGTTLVMTGSRSSVTWGWTVLCRYYPSLQDIHGDQITKCI